MELAYEECKMPVKHILNMLKVLKKKIKIIRRQRGEKKQTEHLEMKNSLSKMKYVIKLKEIQALQKTRFIKSLKQTKGEKI